MDELEIDGKKYLSSKRAAREHKYHIDYIGQLIRAGRVAGKKVGRSWYVEETSLKNYLLSEAGQQPAEQTSVAPNPVPAPSPVEEVQAIHPAFRPQPPAQHVEEKKIEQIQPAYEAPRPVYVQPAVPPVIDREKEEGRVVYFSSPVADARPNTLTYVEDDEPMLPALNGRMRTNADFVPVPVRKIAQETQEEAFEDEIEEETEEPEVTVEPKAKNKFMLPRMQVLAAIAIAVFVITAIASTMLATSIKVSEGGAASVGLTIK